MLRSLPHIFGRVFNTPLAIQPARLEPLLAGLRVSTGARGSYLQGERPEDDGSREAIIEIEIDRTAPSTSGYVVTRAGVAWLPVRGILTKRAGEIDADSTELESYGRLGTTLRRCLADARVRGIMLEVDSCGGEVGGLFELAADIRTARSVKPIWAMANDDALSAGYAIASAAEQIWVSRVAAVGNIGVLAMHCDQSGFDDDAGLNYTYVFAGERKVDGNPHEPLSDEARSAIQTEVDRIYTMFVGMVSAHRGLAAEAVRATEAAVFYGPDAITAGLADRLGSFGEAINALGDLITGGGSTMVDQTIDIENGPRIEPAPLTGTRTEEIVQQAVDEGATVVRLDAVRQATGTVRREAVEIVALCNIAGFPGLATEYINAETALHVVRADLQRRRAEASDAHKIDPIDTAQRTSTASDGLASEISKVVSARFASQMGRT